MHAVVSHVAGAEVVPPGPAVVRAIRAVRHHRGGPDPRVVVEACGRIGVHPGIERAAPLNIPALGDEDVADDALVQSLDRVDHHLRRSALRAVLHQHLVPPGGFDQQPSLANVVRNRLLHVDVFARLAGENRSRGVPVIGRADDDGVQRGIVEQDPHVADRMALRDVEMLRRTGPALIVRIATVRNCRIRVVPSVVGVVGAAPAAPDQSHADPFIGTSAYARRRERRGDGG